MNPYGMIKTTPPLITRGTRPGLLGQVAVVSFDARGGTLELTLYPDCFICWQFHRAAEGKLETGADLRWHWGRIRGSGPTAGRFWDIKESLGLTLGQIEAELRELTRYREGTE